YDGDDVREHDICQAANLMKVIGCDVKVAEVKEGLDLYEYIMAYGGEKFKKEVIDHSDTHFRFFMKYKRKEYNLSIDSERLSYIDEIMKELAMIGSSIEREYYVREIANEFNLSSDKIGRAHV